MSLATKGWLEYVVGGICFMVGLAFILPIGVGLFFPWSFAIRFEADGTVTLWDAVNLSPKEFDYYYIIALFVGIIAAKLGFLLLTWGYRNMKQAEGRRS